MRQLTSSLIGSGGLVAAIAFFLPWVSISCEGQSITSVSAYDRAQGLEAREDVQMPVQTQHLNLDQHIKREPTYWLMFVIPAALVALGVGLLTSLWFANGPILFSALCSAIIGLIFTVKRGLVDQLEIQFDLAIGPSLSLETTTANGPWIAIAGYAVALSGTLITLLVRKELD